MSGSIDRRGFIQTAAAVGSLGPAGALSAAEKSAAQPLYKISLAQWSLHRRLFGRQEPKLDNLEFPATARKLGIDAVEWVNQFFMDKATDTKYLNEMVRRTDGEGVKNLLIMCDREGRLGDPNKKKRLQAVENHKKWLEAARHLGCHSIRVNAASAGGYKEQQKLAADGLYRLAHMAAPYKLNVLVENHGGLSSNGEWLAGVMKRVNHPRCGTLPDFGNFVINRETGESYDRYKGVRELMPFAKAVSAKSHAFDDEGNDTATDFHKMMKIVLDHGYHGYVGIEWEGGQYGDEAKGIVMTRTLLERVRADLAG